ncbi:HHL177Cp [Eremothecium sinecaudum]|uniref:HHL177Cp n=1 Tax=Eremothecium sinecaudum TaxID=45286 RepID=A0A109V0Y3_9SACH|nr:HHL177Cp [Eremothecium sinecaudum]AMD22593.1 HHL177Cp [Eremothecium sinecaudum]
MSLWDQLSLTSQKTSISQNHGIWNEMYNATVGSMFELSAIIQGRADSVKDNFRNDISSYKNFMYPFRGFVEFLSSYRYWGYAAIIGSCYIILFIMLTTLYATFLLPILSTWQIVLLGPIGLVISIMQMILQCNLWTVRGTKWFVLPVVKEDIFDTCLRRRNHGALLNTLKLRPFPVPPSYKKNDLEFWIYQIPIQVFLVLCSISRSFFIIVLSLVPIIGPTIAVVLLSPSRSYNYYNTWMTRLRMTYKMKCDSYYEKLGQHMAFGLSSGIFELFPLISIAGMCSNVIAAALLVEDEIKHDRVALSQAELAEIRLRSVPQD